MCHRVEENINPQTIAVRSKLRKVTWVVSFSFPCVSDIGVVRHHYEESTVFVSDRTEVRFFAVFTAFRSSSPAYAVPKLDRRDLRNGGHMGQGAEDGMI